MKSLYRAAAAASVAAIAFGGFALGAHPASAVPAATITPSTNVADCNGNPGCPKETVTATGFPANAKLALIQCPNAQTIPDLCDNTTTDYGPGIGYYSDASGNFTSTVVPAYVVPTASDAILGNDPGFVCDQSTSCVFLVIASSTFDFSQPHAYTNTFTMAGPAAVAPEVPWAALLPLGALALCGGSYLVLRNRSRSSAAA